MQARTPLLVVAALALLIAPFLALLANANAIAGTAAIALTIIVAVRAGQRD